MSSVCTLPNSQSSKVSSPPLKRAKTNASADTESETKSTGQLHTPGTKSSGNNANMPASNGSMQNGHSANQQAPMEQDGDGAFDTNLYSRMLYALGHTAMTRLRMASVLISGQGGTGVEVAKNLILGGVRNVCIQDTKLANFYDLGAQYYLKEQHIGRNRAETSVNELAELNDSVTVNCITHPLSEQIISKYDLIILTDSTRHEQFSVNDWCRKHGKKMMIVESRGLFAYIFNDFGAQFIVEDTNGEQPVEAMIEYIDKTTGNIGMLEEAKHNLEDGDFIQFAEVKGMTVLNEHSPIKVTTKSPSVISVGPDVLASMGDYTGGGRIKQVKMPKTIQFKSLKESDKEPEFLLSDFAKMDRPAALHALFGALSQFIESLGRLPQPGDIEDGKILYGYVPDEKKSVVDEKLAALFASQSNGSLCPMTSFIGGVAAQEAMKAVTGIFTPIQQWFYFDALECLPGSWSTFDLTRKYPSEFEPRRDRYDSAVAVFGRTFVEHVQNQKWFVVGAGAIGCELLKNFAMMGVACGEKGLVRVTDMDNIELSNLNRQFLFRRHDIGSKKAEAAAKAVTAMNPHFKIKCLAERVGGDTEKTFDDHFFESLDGVCNALDNVEARQYMDRRCVYYRLPLLESGTLGSKGNTQVVFPHLTESYSSSVDPPEKSIPICTLKNFPNAIEHTIQWARELFTGMFTNPAEAANTWLADQRAFQARAEKMHVGQRVEVYSDVKKALVDDLPGGSEQCVRWARDQFEEYFSNTIKQLLHNFPPDQMTSSGTPFWSGAKRCPHPIDFDSSNDEHFDFVYSASILRAQEYGYVPMIDRAQVKKIVDAYQPPKFAPRAGVKIAVTDAEAKHEEESGGGDGGEAEQQVEALMLALAKYRVTKESVLTPIDFEKDDPTNHHLEFVTSASNLRAECYSIAKADLIKTKQIAGRIIPAIATTTAAVAGLVCMEMYKVIAAGPAIDGPAKVPMEVFKNGFLNLALPFFAFSEPMPVPLKEYCGRKFSLWDSLVLKGPMTLEQIGEWFMKEYKLEMAMASSGVSLLFSFFMAADKKKARMQMTMPEVIRSVTGKCVPDYFKSIVVEVMVTDPDTDEDVEIPYVKYVMSAEELAMVKQQNAAQS